MKVHWTNNAVEHLDSIYDYISLDSGDYAKRMVDRLTRRSEQIGKFPYSGRIVPELESKYIREVIEGPYRIIYIIKEEKVDVLAVIHGARQILSQEDIES